jgi:hypothetical protein
VFPNLENRYSEDTSAATAVKLGEWQDVVLTLPQGSGTGRIRVDPADRSCMIELADLKLKRAADGSVLKSWTAAEIRARSITGDVVPLPSNDATRFLSMGRDPWFLLPEIDSALGAQPLVFEARVRIDLDLGPGMAALRSAEALELDSAVAQRDQAVAQRDQALTRNQQLSDEIRSLQAERDQALTRNQQLSAEIRNLQAERIAVVADYRRVHATHESLLNEAASLRNCLASEQERRVQERAKLEAELRIVYQSRSWWLTAPLRRLFRALR